MEIELSQHWSYNICNDPKRFAFVLARYRFAAQMIRNKNRILELGCSEGIGVPILLKENGQYLGIDNDNEAIIQATKNWKKENCDFKINDFLGKKYGNYDAVVSLMLLNI